MKDSDVLSIFESDEFHPTKSSRLDENPAVLYLATLSRSGRRVQRSALNMIANILSPGSDYLSFPWCHLKYNHIVILRVYLQDHYKTATLNRMLCAVRGAIKQAWLLDQIPAVQYLRLKQVKDEKRTYPPAGRYINKTELSAIMQVCISDNRPAGYRDAAIIACMVAGGGLRRSEVVSLILSDYDQESGQIRITGKGNKVRTSYIVNEAADAMADWLVVRGAEPGPIFIPINKGGNMTMRRMTSQTVYYMLKRRADQSGVQNITPHDLRRTFISNMLEAGVDIATISQIVGHEDVKTTANYDRRSELVKKKATQLLTVPYKRRLG